MMALSQRANFKFTGFSEGGESPSARNLDELSVIAEESISQLEEIWEDIGLTQEERRQEIRNLESAVHKLCDEVLQLEDEKEQTLRQTITQTALKSKEICEELGVSDKQEFLISISAEMAETIAARSTADSVSLIDQLRYHRDEFDTLDRLKNERISLFSTALMDLHSLYDHLGDQVPRGYEDIGTDLSQSRLEKIQEKILLVQGELETRKAKAFEIVREIVDLLGILGIDPGSSDTVDSKVAAFAWAAKLMDENADVDTFERLHLNSEATHIITELCNSQNMHLLRQRLKQLALEKERRQEKLKHFAVQITELWDLLDVCTEARQAFFGEHYGLGNRTLSACEDELGRLLERKKLMIKHLITKARAELEELWDSCHVGVEHRRRFLPAFSDCYTEETYEAFKEEIERMKQRLEDMRPILKAIDKWKGTLSEKEEYEKMSNDPNRFKMPGKMLQLEKTRNKLKKLPEVERSLAALISDWEKSHGHLFIDGHRLLSTLQKGNKNASRIGDQNYKPQFEETPRMQYPDGEITRDQNINVTPLEGFNSRLIGRGVKTPSKPYFSGKLETFSSTMISSNSLNISNNSSFNSTKSGSNRVMKTASPLGQTTRLLRKPVASAKKLNGINEMDGMRPPTSTPTSALYRWK